MRIIFLLFFSSSLITSASVPETPKRQILSSFCQPSLSEDLKQSSLSFTDIYSFKIDESGSPIEIKSFRAGYTNVEEIKDCLKEWKLKGFITGAIFHVELSWKHGVGWMRMRISTNNFSQVTIWGDR
jgi:hypothetical protein